MDVVGAGRLPRTFKVPKSVCVSSLEGGPRSVVLGLVAWRVVLWENRRGCERGFEAGDLPYGAGEPVSLLWQSCMCLCVAR